MRCQMVDEIEIVSVLFKMVSAAIGKNTRVQNVGFGYTPAVKSRLRKKRLKQGIITHLDIATTKTPPFYQGVGGEGSQIVMVENPSCCGHVAVASRSVHCAQLLESSCCRLAHSHAVLMRSID